MGRKLRKVGVFLYRFVFHESPPRAAVASFAFVIVLATLLLTLPVSSKARTWTPPVDCLFTATSAVCVTGLLVKSTPQHWSLFGQLVILTMIQIGGLGIMTMGAFVAIMLRRRLSIRFEAAMNDIVDAGSRESVWMLVRFICLFTLLAEVIGAIALYLGWRASFPTWQSCLYHSVFHSISAFCNAGFSLNNDSLMGYVGSVPVNLTVCALIVVGGLGFLTVRDLKRWAGWRLTSRKGKRPRLTTHSRLVLTVTGTLLVSGFLLFLLIETREGQSLHEAGIQEKVLAALFQSVTPRTAGFNTVEMGAGTLAPATVFMIMALMFVGGSPGSTAGGIKTTTVGVMVASIAATLRGRDKAELFHHTVPEEIVHRVASIILLCGMALATGIFLLLLTEGEEFRFVAFEATSAFGTVGLSTGLTGPDCSVSALGKLVLTALMFTGRLGPITLVLSVAQLKERAAYRYPEDQVLVG
jgi:trk system potassium uptake protein TrkH